MNPKTKKIILSSVPYLFAALFATKLGLAWRLAEGADASEKALSLLIRRGQAALKNGTWLPIRCANPSARARCRRKKPTELGMSLRLAS